MPVGNKQTQPEFKQVNVKLDESLYASLKRQADSEFRTISDQIRLAITKNLEEPGSQDAATQ